MKILGLILIFILCQFSLAGTEVQDKTFILNGIVWSAPNDIKDYFKNYFNDYKGKQFDPLSFKLKVDQVNKELIAMGFFDSTVTYSIESLANKSTIAHLDFKIGERSNFYFKGNTQFSFQELRQKITDKIKNDLGKVDLDQIKQTINELYEDVGIYNTKTDIFIYTGVDKTKNRLKNFIITIAEGDRIPVTKIIFRGNNSLSSAFLKELYDQNGTSLAKAGFYDRVYVEKFSNIVKKKYLSLGYVYAEVSKPRVTSNEDEPVDLEFAINEKSQFTIGKINFENLDENEAAKLKKSLENQEGKPINIPELEPDFKRMITHLQGQGYYFASISNLNSDNLITYDNLSTTANLNISLSLEKKICFNDAIINGNYMTKSEVILREITLSKNDLITPDKIESLRQKLSGLGLFASLRINPYMIYEKVPEGECNKANLIIQVKERDFGLVELTPGFRTDLGAKTAIGLTYNNIGGMNRSFSVKAQGNQRFNLDSLDERRRIEDKKLFEYLAKVSFSEPYLFSSLIKTQVEFEMSASLQRKRFANFDAKITRLSPQLSKNFNKNFSSSIKYQLERIIQSDATESKDNDNFTIGSITPSATIDFRDDPINPKRGSYFNISSEWANNYFGSMKSDDFEVNYLKLTSRNKFYFSFGDFIFATSLTGGFEKNYANNFYIPSIKVFRLDGFDEIRGFEDSEINRLSSGTEISKVVVSNRAYFLAFKFEPRYNLSDNMQIDVFFDAGRVFVNEFRPLDLRTSVGAGFKILTPVGSLDFDYGVKLKRETYSDGKRDAFGRFHLSIGFF